MTTEAPKPKPPVAKLEPIQPTAKESTPSVKRPFVQKPHLTDRPFQNDALKKLRSEMPNERPRKNFSGRSSANRPSTNNK